MTRRVFAAGALWMGCKGMDVPPPPAPDATGVTAETAETDLPVDPVLALALPPTGTAENARFATSDTCAACHSNHSASTAMRDSLGREVGPYDLWRASMMANAARDPIWRAVVSAEIAATPAAADIIGERCMNCHAPMAATDARLAGEAPPNLATLSSGTERGSLALDGASCTLCHQIEAAGLGSPETWKGNYPLLGERKAYGPHAAPMGSAMQAAGWTPLEGAHIGSAGLCATCHTLITEALDPSGAPNGGVLVEQSPYLEMLNSQSAASGCQSCHFPPWGEGQVPILTDIARQPSGPDYPELPSRSMGRHVLVGGNTLVPQLFREFHDVLNPNAPPEAFDAKILAAREQLQVSTASLSVTDLALAASTLSFQVRTDPRTGHKFPTGIPIRRAWLEVVVWDGAGQRVFASGSYDAIGRILDADGEVQPFELAGGPVSPHHDLVTSGDQAVIYESVMADLAGQPTWLLLRGAGWYKDNRLLPPGWSPMNANIAMIAPMGVGADADYTTGGDRVRFQIDTTGRSGPFTVQASLLYQPLSHRFGEELFLADTPETRGLEAMLAAVDRRPEIVAVATGAFGGP